MARGFEHKAYFICVTKHKQYGNHSNQELGRG